MVLGLDPAEVPEPDHAAEETSLWPLLAAFTLSFFVMGLTISPLLGGAGLAALVAAVAGWSWANGHQFAEREPEEPPSDSIWMSRHRLWWGSLMLVISEAALFVALFVVLGVYGVTEPPVHEHIRDLNTPAVMVASVVLWSSGFAGSLAGRRLEEGSRIGFLVWLGLAILMGTAFMGYQVYEYVTLYDKGFTLASGHDASVFYGLTGLHGFHVLGGLVALVVLWFYVLEGNLGPDRQAPFEAVMLYWHFVDAAWVFIYASLYLRLF